MVASLVVNNLAGAVVGPLDLTVEAGTCVAITGPSGAGKSLLLRMIADLDPNEGDVSFGTLDRAAVSAPIWRRAVCYVAAEPGWWADTAAAHLQVAQRVRAKTLAARLGLAAALFDRPLSTLSTGERQRLGLVRALCAEPSVLLLDEPTSALDEQSAGAVDMLLREALGGGMTLVLVTHDRRLADAIGDRRLELVAGRLVSR